MSETLSLLLHIFQTLNRNLTSGTLQNPHLKRASIYPTPFHKTLPRLRNLPVRIIYLPRLRILNCPLSQHEIRSLNLVFPFLALQGYFPLSAFFPVFFFFFFFYFYFFFFFFF